MRDYPTYFISLFHESLFKHSLVVIGHWLKNLAEQIRVTSN